MTRDEILNLIGEFTWNFGQEFFIETTEGNFIWSDPDYNGDNTITQTVLSYEEWIKPVPFGRSKGRHMIRQYCGESVVVK